MSGSGGPNHSAVQKSTETLDLTDDVAEAPHASTSSYTASSSYQHFGSAPSQAHYPPEAGSAYAAYHGPRHVEHPTFPSGPSHHQQRVPDGILRQYNSPHGPSLSFAANRQPLLDQSVAYNRNTQAQIHPPRFTYAPPCAAPPPRSSNTSGLFLQAHTTITRGPDRLPTFKSRNQLPFAPAIATSVGGASSSRPYGGQHGTAAPRQSHPPTSQHHHYFSQPAGLSRAPVGTIPFVRGDEVPSPPRSKPLPPGFTFTFGPLESPAGTQQHAHTHAVDLTQDERDPSSEFQRVYHDDYDMAGPSNPTGPRKAIPILPSDPTTGRGAPVPEGIQHGAGGAGWTTPGFNDDDEGGAGHAPGQGKGKGKGRANHFSGGRAATGGKGRASTGGSAMGAVSEKTALSKLRVPKVANQTSVSSASFHGAGPSTYSGGAESGPSRGRVIAQDAPETAQERKGAARKKTIAKQAAGKKSKKVASSAAKTEVVELSSSDDDDDDEIEDADADVDADGASGSGSGYGSGAGAGAAARGIAVKGAAARAQQRSAELDADEPSSDDPLGFSAKMPRGDRGKERRASEIAERIIPGGVRGRIAEYEALDGARGRTSVVKGLKSRTKALHTDGGPTDDGEYDVPATAPTGAKAPRASKQVVERGKGKGKATAKDNNLWDRHRIMTIPIESYMLSRAAVQLDYRSTVFKLLLNIGGHRANPQLTLQVRARGAEQTRDVDFKKGVVQSCEFWDGSFPYVELRLDMSKPGAKEIYATLKDLVRTIVDEHEKTVIFPFHQAPHEDWETDPETWTGESATLGIDRLFYTCAYIWGGTRAAASKAKTVETIYMDRRQTADECDDPGDMRDEAYKGKGKGKKAVLEPNQTRLSFGGTARDSRLQEDASGDLVDIGVAPRRSNRASTSNFASESRQVAAQRPPRVKSPPPEPYPLDQVVLEYPQGEPGAVSVTWADTKRLKDEEFLNDTLIEFGLKRIMKGIEERDRLLPDEEKLAPQIHVFNSFFYKQYSTPKTKSVDPYLLVEKWTKRVDLFSKKYIVIPINEYMHWYLAIIVNPKAILNPPPPSAPPAPSRKSNRVRKSTTNSDYTVDSPGGSPEVVSEHFRRPARSLREADVEAHAEEDQREREQNERVQREYREHEERKEDAAVRDQIERVKASKAEDAQSVGIAAKPVEAMQLDSDGDEAAGGGGEAQANGAAHVGDDEDMLEASTSPPPPAQAEVDARMRSADAMSEDEDVRRVRPEVEGGGGANRHVSEAGASQGHHTRFGNDDDDDISIQIQVKHATENDSGDDLPSPDRIGALAKKLRRGSRPGAAPSGLTRNTEQLTLDDEEDDSFKAPAVAPESVPMQQDKSTSSSATTASTSTGAAAELADRSAPAPVTYGSSSRAGKSTSVPATTFGPTDPEPGRQEEVARQRQEEETQRRARVGSDAMEVEAVSLNGWEPQASPDDCWVLTFDSLGGAHRNVTERLKTYLGREAQAKRGLNMSQTSWKQAHGTKVEVPQQPNSCDCGLYLLHYVETFFKNPQLYLDTVVSTFGRPAPRAKAKKQAEEHAALLWAGDIAQQKRTAMRAEVHDLVEQWVAATAPQREEARRAREARRHERMLEKQAQLDREAAQRASELEAEELASRTAPAQEPAPKRKHAAEGQPQPPAPPVEAALPPRAHAPATPPPSKGKSKGKGKARAHDEANGDLGMLELSDDQSSPKGSPRKSPRGPAPAEAEVSTTPSGPAPPQDNVGAASTNPPTSTARRRAKRPRAAYDETATEASTSTTVPLVEQDTSRSTRSSATMLRQPDPVVPFSFEPSRPRPSPPAKSRARLRSPPPPMRVSSGDDEPESGEMEMLVYSPEPAPPARDERASKKHKTRDERASKKHKTRHGDATLAAPPLVDYDSDSADVDEESADAKAAVSQELYGPAAEEPLPPPPPAQAQAQASSSNFKPPRKKVKNNTDMIELSE